MISKEGRHPAGPVGLVDAVGAPVDLMDSRAGGADECPPLVLLARHAPAMASALSPAAVTGLHARPGPGLREQLGPSGLGYQRMPTDAPRDRVTARDRATAGDASMTVFAARRGWEIAEMFVADDPHRPYLAFAQLPAACRTRHPVAVLLARPGDLPPELLDRVRREAGIPVLVATAPVLAGGRRG